MEYVNTVVAVHTYTQTYCLDWTLLTVFTAPCCLELHCFSSWRSRARFVFIVTSFSASWLSSVIKVFSQLFHCLLVCVSCLCVCVCQCWVWNSLMVKMKSQSTVTIAPGFHWRLVFTLTAGMSEQCLWLNWTLLICPHSFGTLPSSLNFPITCGF